MATMTLRTPEKLPRRSRLVRDAGLLLLAALPLTACGRGSGGAAAGEEAATRPFQLMEVDLATAELGGIVDHVDLTGSLEPYRVVNLTAQVPGTLVELHADRGEVVRNGQALAVLQAEGIRGTAEAAESQLAVARQTLEGARKLYEAGAMSELDYEAARASYDAARAAAAGASENARHATVRSPLDGVVSARWASEGETVSPGQPVLTVVDTRVLELRAQLPVEEAIRVRPGQPVQFEVNGYPGRTFRGEVDRVEPTADPTTRQVGVYARLENPDGRMPGGLFARGRIAVDQLDEVVVVPAGALRDQAGRTVVYVLEDGVIRHRPVQPGPADPAAGTVAVLEGLAPGERVVVTPTVDVSDGTPADLATATPTGED